MEFPDEQIRELVALYPEVQQAEEAAVRYFLLPNFALPEGRTPATVDALLCPSPRDGYPSRLYFASRVEGGKATNWNASNVRILERNWFAFSWKTRDGLRLAQMIGAHLDGLR